MGGSKSRRAFLTGAFTARNVALAAVGGLAWTYALDLPGAQAAAPCRPPGALPERDFLATCIRCGRCVQACPYDTLELATPTDDVVTGTPWFEPRVVPCYMCEDVPCAAVCPSGALEKDTDIADARMGLAVLVDQENCLAFRGLRCEACYRACPVIGDAITLEYEVNQQTRRHANFLPVVHAEACTGCGMCEHACVMQRPAIRVLPPSVARGSLGDHYRFEGFSGTITGRESVTATPGEDMDHVLETMDDLSGIEGP
jgi:ferredoxin-type protein NapG